MPKGMRTAEGIEGLLFTLFNEPFDFILSVRRKGELKHPCKNCKKKNSNIKTITGIRNVIPTDFINDSFSIPPTIYLCAEKYGDGFVQCWKLEYYRKVYIKYILAINYLFRNNNDHVLAAENIAEQLLKVDINKTRKAMLERFKKEVKNV